jgi:thiamine-phosphate pyrophosphorylase
VKGVDFRVYLITDRKKVREDKFLGSVAKALKGGIQVVQLREKDLPVRALLGYAYDLRKLTRKYGALLMVNDRVDVALAAGADGVHLGYASMPVDAVRRITGEGFVIGVSTHSLTEALNAQRSGADFISYGPVYETPSKVKYGKPVGIGSLKDVVREIAIPVYALGGIDAQNIPAVMETGVKGVAMISAIFGAGDIEEKTKEIVRLVR